MHRIVSTVLLGVLSAGTVGAVGGCSDAKYSNANNAMSVKLTIDHDTVKTGEVVTVQSFTENTLNRKAELKWVTTGGTLKTLDDGRAVQVMFDAPGTYSITAMLMADGMMVDKAVRTVEVKPVPTATMPAM